MEKIKQIKESIERRVKNGNTSVANMYSVLKPIEYDNIIHKSIIVKKYNTDFYLISSHYKPICKIIHPSQISNEKTQEEIF